MSVSRARLSFGVLATMLSLSAWVPAYAADTQTGVLPALSQVTTLIKEINPTLPLPLGERYAQALLADARERALDPCLLFAIVSVESHFNAAAISPHGAVGLGQLMPVTAASLHIDPSSPFDNLRGTSQYLRTLLDRFALPGQSTEQRAIAAYNAGPGAVLRNHGSPTSTANAVYVTRVFTLWQAARARLGGAATTDHDPSPAPVSNTASIAAPQIQGVMQQWHVPSAWQHFDTHGTSRHASTSTAEGNSLSPTHFKSVAPLASQYKRGTDRNPFLFRFLLGSVKC